MSYFRLAIKCNTVNYNIFVIAGGTRKLFCRFQMKKKTTIRHTLAAVFPMIAISLFPFSRSMAQVARLGEDIQYQGVMSFTASSGDNAPFWFTNNRFGQGTTKGESALFRLSARRDAEADSLRKWRIGYGADMAALVNFDSPFILQQLYVDAQWKALRLSVGQKERPMALKNQRLSSGALTEGINARPIPQVRLELPHFWSIPGTRGWLALKAHVAYGAFTDNAWQREHVGDNGHRAANILYHSKAGFLRIGNTQKFPLSLTGGLEMSAQFGGEAWNVNRRPDDTSDFDDTYVKMGHGFRDFLDAFFMGGSDASDGAYSNVAGNQLGSWHLRLDYAGKGWSASAYAEHFFEDHSQLFWQYAWKDMLYGVEVNLPGNPFLSTIVYEHLGTKDQSGSIYHDGTANIPDQISATDNYYNHGTYTGWHHAGFAMGSPLLLSPIYSKNNIYFFHNRVVAHHVGLSGQPCKNVEWRLLYTHQKSWGTYDMPLLDPQKANYLLAEASYSPSQVPGLCVRASYGMNQGKLLGNSHGAMLTVVYSGWINSKKGGKK